MVIGNGALYGGTADGGTSGTGTIFQLAPRTVAGGTWTETVLHRFHWGKDGANPFASPVWGNRGQPYGTADGGSGAYGVAFELAPPTPSSTTWTYTVLHSLTGGCDGASPAGVLLLGGNGKIYGMTS